MDRDRLSADIQRAEHAKALLENVFLRDAFDSVEKALFAEFRKAKPSDTEVWQRCHMALGVLDAVKKVLESHVKNGTLAAADLKVLIQGEDRKRGFLKVLNG